MPPCRGKIIRPLIDITREEIMDYLVEKKANYMTDSSNLTDDYLRNRVRAHIIPQLAQLNPDIVNTLGRTSTILSAENDHLEAETTKAMLRIFSRKSDTRIELFLSPMEVMPAYLLRRALRRAVDAARTLRSLSYQNIEDIMDLIKRGKSGDRIYLPHNLRAIRDYSVLIITSEEPARLKTYSLDIGDEVVIEEARIILRATKEEQPADHNGRSSAVFDLDKVSLPLTIRPREQGDFFLPSGFGKKKKLQDLFVDEKVPRDERDAVPVICSGNDIIWVYGIRTDDRFIAKDVTDKFLVLTSASTK
jgi:tRNA(Ile)-lysidine synthase